MEKQLRIPPPEPGSEREKKFNEGFQFYHDELMFFSLLEKLFCIIITTILES